MKTVIGPGRIGSELAIKTTCSKCTTGTLLDAAQQAQRHRLNSLQGIAGWRLETAGSGLQMINGQGSVAVDANTERKMAPETEHFCILGAVGAPVFATWIARHAAKLGLKEKILAQSAERVDLLIMGPSALLDAMAMALACSLGPLEVLVDHIERHPAHAAFELDSCSILA